MIRRTGRRTEQGAVTAETAVVLPLIAAFAVGLTWTISLGVTQMRAVDAAREVARAAARGDDAGAARAIGRQVAPKAARISVSSGQDAVAVQVSAKVRGPGGLFAFLPQFTVRARAIAAPEETGARP